MLEGAEGPPVSPSTPVETGADQSHPRPEPTPEKLTPPIEQKRGLMARLLAALKFLPRIIFKSSKEDYMQAARRAEDISPTDKVQFPGSAPLKPNGPLTDSGQ